MSKIHRRNVRENARNIRSNQSWVAHSKSADLIFSFVFLLFYIVDWLWSNWIEFITWRGSRYVICACGWLSSHVYYLLCMYKQKFGNKSLHFPEEPTAALENRDSISFQIGFKRYRNELITTSCCCNRSRLLTTQTSNCNCFARLLLLSFAIEICFLFDWNINTCKPHTNEYPPVHLVIINRMLQLRSSHKLEVDIQVDIQLSISPRVYTTLS